MVMILCSACIPCWYVLAGGSEGNTSTLRHTEMGIWLRQLWPNIKNNCLFHHIGPPDLNLLTFFRAHFLSLSSLCHNKLRPSLCVQVKCFSSVVFIGMEKCLCV